MLSQKLHCIESNTFNKALSKNLTASSHVHGDPVTWNTEDHIHNGMKLILNLLVRLARAKITTAAPLDSPLH